MRKTYLSSIVLLCAIFFDAKGQAIKVPPALNAWDTLSGAKPVEETYMGKKCLRVDSGMIVIKGAELRDGIIEADINFPHERSFPGFAVRMQDAGNFESFYLRPHQSGNLDATQYTPEFNGQTGFQLYYGEGYDNAYTFTFDEWQHIRIELHGLQAEFYINDTPVIRIKELLTGWKTGKMAIGTDGAPLRIANVQYTVRQNMPPVPVPMPANGSGGIITQWQISNAVNRSLFEKHFELTAFIKKKLLWTTQNTDPTGLMNLAKFSQRTDTTNTIVAKIAFNSMSKQVKELSFGFSDYVTIYLNGKALYYGNNKQYSRDYRFLGTIGYFEKLFLPLKKGVNILCFVVSEDFGGWGMQAKFENMDGISLK